MRSDLEQLQEEAERFIYTCYEELGHSREDAQARLVAVMGEIEVTGTYVHTTEELEQGCKMAWRNSNRCIGRLFWDKLRIVDARHADTAGTAADAVLNHIHVASNGGKVIPMITILPPDGPNGAPVRVWNHQLIRYAGYETEQGIIGDPASVELTKAAMSLGWQGAGSSYDVLPLIIQVQGQAPEWYVIPEEEIVEVMIEHPEQKEIAELGMRWYGVPMIADMRLEIGGISYPAAPFNGWYMGTEIGARNLADTFRYNKLPAVAAACGLNTSSETTLWKDRALVELNVAVLHSFKKAGVSIVDHHTAAAQFAMFEQREEKAGRKLTGDWVWLIPPVSPATTHIFHSSYRNEIVKPNFFHQDQAYTLKDGVASAAELRSSEQQNAQVEHLQPQGGDALMKCPFAH
ncbi:MULTISPECIES: nitric oxide synthase oxygenase [Paenibacillus]|uniref:nitric oxide synthase oxygenase n=1 Tax=Paenibacillus TaxID=44249 RepID=UPI000B81213B|nr:MULTISPECIES: nitric oxide synthase oxygenase [Paenibacillus]PRA03561.1 nitric oxide synthase oxygenase [Paenibacillus sp. MYb63]PRA46979.1 nitric oxide synthase oxygenase [Paenibacillus sp. MYb67]